MCEYDGSTVKFGVQQMTTLYLSLGSMWGSRGNIARAIVALRGRGYA
jgi:hypothetical protein